MGWVDIGCALQPCGFAVLTHPLGRTTKEGRDARPYLFKLSLGCCIPQHPPLGRKDSVRARTLRSLVMNYSTVSRRLDSLADWASIVIIAFRDNYNSNLKYYKNKKSNFVFLSTMLLLIIIL